MYWVLDLNKLACVNAARRTVVSCRVPTRFTSHRYYSTTLDARFKNTSPSSSEPSVPRNNNTNADEGHLSFTKSSLYKLTLPLGPSAGAPTSESVKSSKDPEEGYDANGSIRRRNDDETWEEQIERGQGPFPRANDNDGTQPDGPRSVIFLLHSGQPLSYIANLVRAEGPVAESDEQISGDTDVTKRKSNPLEDPSITFHTSLRSNQSWSPATGIGDFLREAARVGSFTVSIGSRNIRVNVPTFEERTRFLRAALHSKTKRIGNLARVKDECDRIARLATQRYAFTGAVIMASWWVTVGVLTFETDLGWDVMEPVTYLTGFGIAIGGYIWFLWHNREVSYRTILTETTSRRQQKLYVERGFDIEAYHELIDEVKGLRRAIKRIAWDYELEWDQGDTADGRNTQRALEIVRREEELDRRKKHREEEQEEEDAYVRVDNDGDGKPDHRS